MDSAQHSFEIPENITQQAAEVRAQLLPKKSRDRYEKEYELFCEWRKQKKVKTVNDDVFLVYMSEKAKLLKPSTLWSRYSMIKSCLSNIFVNYVHTDGRTCRFPQTIAFLKRQGVGYIPKKAKVLSAEQVTKFICEAPDQQWLLTKVLLIFGIFGACRRDDLIRLTIDDVVDNGSFLVVFLRDGKNNKSRTFTITDEGCPFQPCTIYRKYANLRPQSIETKRLFISYRNGRCYAQHVGCHIIGDTSKRIAHYLQLANPNEYTGHSLRRSSATMLVEGGADLLALKQHGGWRSSGVAEGYVEESMSRKVELSRRLFNQTPNTSISKAPTEAIDISNNSTITLSNKPTTVTSEKSISEDSYLIESIENKKLFPPFDIFGYSWHSTN